MLFKNKKCSLLVLASVLAISATSAQALDISGNELPTVHKKIEHKSFKSKDVDENTLVIQGVEVEGNNLINANEILRNINLKEGANFDRKLIQCTFSVHNYI